MNERSFIFSKKRAHNKQNTFPYQDIFLSQIIHILNIDEQFDDIGLWLQVFPRKIVNSLVGDIEQFIACGNGLFEIWVKNDAISYIHCD